MANLTCVSGKCKLLKVEAVYSALKKSLIKAGTTNHSKQN